MKKSKGNQNKLLKNIAKIISGVVIGYLLYYTVFMEIIPLFVSGDLPYFIVSIACLIGSIGGCIAVISLITSKKINKNLFIVLCAVYFLTLICVLFMRRGLERVFVFNLFTGISDMFSNLQSAIQALMNFIAFIPMGYFFKKLKLFPAVVLALFISVAIELVQVATVRGFFDVFDILLYILGLLSGRFIFKKLNLQIG